MPYTVLSHTADTGIEATAGSLTDLIEELAAGMFGLVADLEPCPADYVIRASVEAPSTEDLVVDVLAELVYRSEVENLFLCEFEVQATSATAVEVVAGGVEAQSVELLGPPIKAVTYHGLMVDQNNDGWYGRVYFDV